MFGVTVGESGGIGWSVFRLFRYNGHVRGGVNVGGGGGGF